MSRIAVAALLATLCACSSSHTTSVPIPASLARGGVASQAPAVNDDAPAVGVAQAAEGRMPVDLPTVLKLAVGRNLDVRIVKETAREAHAEMVRAGQWILPTVRLPIRYQHVDGNVQATEGRIVDVTKDNVFLGASVYADWELGDAIYDQLAAKQRRGAACQAGYAEMNDRALEAALAYFDLMYGQAFLEIADASVALYEDLAGEAEAAVKAGAGFRGDVLGARARLSHAKVQRQQAIEAIGVASATLREVLDLPNSVELYASDPQPVKLELIGPDETEPSLVRKAFLGRPELREARMLAAAADAEKKGTVTGEFFPDVHVGYEPGWFGSFFDDLGGTSDTRVGLSWTVGPGGIGDTARQASAAARYRRAILEGRKVKGRIVREVSAAHTEVRARGGAIEVSEVGAAEAQESLDLYQERLRQGVGVPLDTITAEETLTQARIDYLQSVIGFNKAQMKLLRAIGRIR